MTQAEVREQVVKMMCEMFELSPEDLRPEATLFGDLDLDSIDAIDMAVKLQELTGRRVEESAFRQVRTVADVFELVAKHLQATA